MKFSKIQYVDASQQQQKFNNKKTIFDYGICLAFLAKKQSKLIKNEENSQDPNRLVKFSEIWYLDAFQHKKIH